MNEPSKHLSSFKSMGHEVWTVLIFVLINTTVNASSHHSYTFNIHNTDANDFLLPTPVMRGRAEPFFPDSASVPSSNSVVPSSSVLSATPVLSASLSSAVTPSSVSSSSSTTTTTTTTTNALSMFGWLYPSSDCELSDVPTQSHETPIGIVVFNTSVLLSCDTSRLSQLIKEKGLSGMMQLCFEEICQHRRLNGGGMYYTVLLSEYGEFKLPSVHMTESYSTSILYKLAQEYLWMEFTDTSGATSNVAPTNPRYFDHSTTWVNVRSSATVMSTISTISQGDQDRTPSTSSQTPSIGKPFTQSQATIFLYIVIGTVTGAVTGMFLLTMGRFCCECTSGLRGQNLRIGGGHGRSRNRFHQYEDDVPHHIRAQQRQLNMERQRDMGRLLQHWPIGPYPQTLGQLYCVAEDGTKPCAVCFEDLQLSTRCRTMPCSHVFHADCIDPWIRENQTCPICVRNVWCTNSTGCEELDLLLNQTPDNHYDNQDPETEDRIRSILVP